MTRLGSGDEAAKRMMCYGRIGCPHVPFITEQLPQCCTCTSSLSILKRQNEPMHTTLSHEVGMHVYRDKLINAMKRLSRPTGDA